MRYRYRTRGDSEDFVCSERTSPGCESRTLEWCRDRLADWLGERKRDRYRRCYERKVKLLPRRKGPFIARPKTYVYMRLTHLSPDMDDQLRECLQQGWTVDPSADPEGLTVMLRMKRGQYEKWLAQTQAGQ